ncbi:TrkA family potassium uptake protein [Kocuria palustris]|uniref:potassium channel family protein n=1 Tax=Kocuria palustris TaxID=71999 RepID=UPI0011A31059|nr:TrkA family potassium uptake protein [Kocuria palustris]
MPHFVIMGSGRVGAMIAHALEDAGHTVALIDQDERAFRKLHGAFAGSRITGQGFDREVLRRAGIERAYAFAAVSSEDNSNILAARVARETFDVAHVVARIYDPARAEFYQRLGVPTVAAVRWTADQVLRRLLPEQSISGDYQEASGRLQLGELTLHDSWAGLRLTAIEEAASVRVAFITRFGEGVLPGAATTYQKGDLVHAMMRVEEIDDVVRVLAHPPSPEIRDAGQKDLLEPSEATGGRR